MGKFLLAIAVFAVLPLMLAQQILNNDSVITMVKMGFPEDIIVNAINRSPGAYNTSANGLIVLKNAGVGSKAISAIVAKETTPAQPSAPASPAAPPQIVPSANVPSTARTLVAETLRRRHQARLRNVHNRSVLLPPGDCMLRSASKLHRALLSTVIVTGTAMAITQATLEMFR